MCLLCKNITLNIKNILMNIHELANASSAATPPFKETGSAMFGLQRFSSSVEEEDGELEEALGLVML